MPTFQIYERLKRAAPPELAEAIADAFEVFYEQLQRTVPREDFTELKQIVADLGAAQRRTELRIEELAEAQKRTEKKVEELAEAQKRTEQRVEELAEAQKRTEKKVEELAEAQKRTDLRIDRLAVEFDRRMGVLGARWGDGAEETFRRGLLEHVRELGYQVEHYHGLDPEGYINHVPGRSYDLDVLTHNGTTIVTEIKSNASGADVTEFARSVSLFERQTGRRADRKILVAVTIQAAAVERARELDVTVTTGFYDL